MALPEILCVDSFQETVRNMASSNKDITGDFHLTLGNKELYEGSFLFKTRYVASPKKWESPLRVSYVAPNSFNDSRIQQVRGFKTERSIDAEMKRNPSMTTRFRDVLSEY